MLCAASVAYLHCRKKHGSKKNAPAGKKAESFRQGLIPISVACTYITDCLQAEVRAGCPAQGQLPAILPGAGPLRKALFPFCGIPQDNQRIVPGVVLCGIVQAAKFLMFL